MSPFGFRLPLALLALPIPLLAASGTARPPLVVALDAPAVAGPATPPTSPSAARPPRAPCARGTLPDGDVCVHLPGDPGRDGEGDADDPDAPIASNLHRERSGRWAIYDQIPRRPDRPADYAAYVYPVTAASGAPPVVSGYDLDLPDDRQRRGRTLHAVGHGGVDLPQPRGTPVHAVALEHQTGDADVVYVGPLFGTTVVTRQTLREAGELRDYLLLYGHLDAAAAGVTPGAIVRAGETLGFVGDTGSPELVHLHLEARRVRAGVDVMKVAGGGPDASARLLASEVSVVCDPRNVLPLRRAP